MTFHGVLAECANPWLGLCAPVGSSPGVAVLFFVAPLLIVLIISFMTRGTGGLPVLPFTLEHYSRAFGTYGTVIGQSVRFALITTVFCLVMGYPIAYFIKTRTTRFGKTLALFLVILPFWTNFLIRTYAWKFLLAREGFLNGVLLEAGIISQPIQLLNTEFAVLVGLIYGMLPFMVLLSTPRWNALTSTT